MMSSRHLAAFGQMSPILNVYPFSKPMRLGRAQSAILRLYA